MAQDSFRGIIPFETSKADVEAKIGKPNSFGRYEFEEGRVYIHYRENECLKTDTSCFCLAPLGTVLSVNMELYYDLYVEDLKLDPVIWKKSQIKGHVIGLEAYDNPQTGVTYTVQNGKGRFITFRESEATCKRLTKKIISPRE